LLEFILRLNFLKAIGISIALHASICFMFTFTLSPRQSAFQPYFISLGSILMKEDMIENFAPANINHSQLNDKEVLRENDGKLLSVRSAKLDKPGRISKALFVRKQSQKSFFETEFPVRPPPTKEELEQLRSELGLEPVTNYLPLRFQTR
jgi:hypothetical protein